jgi:serine protease inhibitor ecotin
MYDRWGTYKGWGYSYQPMDDISGFLETMTDRVIEIDDDSYRTN